MRAAASDIAGDYVDVFAPDVLNLMGFYASLRKLLFDCGVHDFSFQDLQKPSHERLSKIFSYIINFVRFRETQTNEIVRHFEKVEKTKERIELLYKENQEMEQEVEELKRLKKLKESRAQEKIQRNQELKQRLRTMLASQNEVVARYEGLQRRKDELTGLLEEKTTTAIQLRQESAKLKPYVLQSPSALQASLADLGSTLSSEKGQIEGLDRRARALQTSTDSFTLISTDVLSSIKILEEIATELAKEEEVNSKNTGQRDALSERGNNVREVEREETLLRRQLAKYVERTEKLKEQSYEKAEAARKRMEELRREHKMAVESRNEEVRGLDQRRLRIEQTEKKVSFKSVRWKGIVRVLC